MNGKNHERLNFLLLLPATFFLGWQHLDIIQSLSFTDYEMGDIEKRLSEWGILRK